MRTQLPDSIRVDIASRSDGSDPYYPDPDPDGDSDLGTVYGLQEGGHEEGVDDEAARALDGLRPRRRKPAVGPSPAMSGLAVEQTAWSLARLGASPPDDWAGLFLATSYEAMPGLR